MNREHQNAASIGIIGSADGPTSVFIAGKGKMLPHKARIHNYLYQRRCNRAAKTIAPGTHTLEEMVAYAVCTYGARDTNEKLGELPSVSIAYEIKAGSHYLAVEIDDTRETFDVSFSGNKKEIKQAMAIARDLLWRKRTRHQRKNRKIFCPPGVLSA